MRHKRDTNSKDEKKERKRERQIERDPSRRKRETTGRRQRERMEEKGISLQIFTNKLTVIVTDRKQILR